MSSTVQQQLELEGVSHDNTPTSKRLRAIEKSLTRELDSIVRKIKLYINPLQASIELDSKFKPIYEQQVHDILTQAAQESYVLGISYIANLRVFRDLHTYLTTDDIEYINSLVTEYKARFWGRIALTTKRGGNKIFGTAIIIDKELGIINPKDTFLNTKYIGEPIAVGLTNIALNQATIRKLRFHADHVNPVTINVPPPPKAIQRIAQAAEKEKDEETEEEALLRQAQESGVSLQTSAGLAILGTLISAITSLKVIWITSRDERVCPICKPLHGKTWSIFANDMPIPIMGTHDRCRCRLVILDRSSISSS